VLQFNHTDEVCAPLLSVRSPLLLLFLFSSFSALLHALSSSNTLLSSFISNLRHSGDGGGGGELLNSL